MEASQKAVTNSIEPSPDAPTEDCPLMEVILSTM